jgi:hypothetical protein
MLVLAMATALVTCIARVAGAPVPQNASPSPENVAIARGLLRAITVSREAQVSQHISALVIKPLFLLLDDSCSAQTLRAIIWPCSQTLSHTSTPSLAREEKAAKSRLPPQQRLPLKGKRTLFADTAA